MHHYLHNITKRLQEEPIPQGISVTKGERRDHIYLRNGDHIATITIPKRGWDFTAAPIGMYYEVIQ
jgi:hypothetical protein